jgi:mRNA-degrading endonuclease RelE of RelBE toxin-antitoxin system
VAYRIELTKSAVKELEKLPAKPHDKVIEHLVQLEQNPRMQGAEKPASYESAITGSCTK